MLVLVLVLALVLGGSELLSMLNPGSKDPGQSRREIEWRLGAENRKGKWRL